MRFNKNDIQKIVIVATAILVGVILIFSITRIKDRLDILEEEHIIKVDSLNDIIDKLKHEIDILTKSNDSLEDKLAIMEIENKKLNKHLEANIIPTRSSTRTVGDSKSFTGTNGIVGNLVSLGSFQATAYCGCTKCCGPNAKGITATGTKVTANRTIAVDPNVISLGSRVIINGQEYVAEDTGSAVKGKIVDIYFNSHSEALKFGRQKVDVKIIK